MLWKQANGSIHQLEKGIQDFRPARPVNHTQEKVLMSSKREGASGRLPLKITLFRNFHMFQVVANQIKWRTRPPLFVFTNSPNLIKWFHPSSPIGIGLPIHLETAAHTAGSHKLRMSLPTS
ncbi:hypothetical protein QL285_067009 [Trifolium repens]|nr:hypothetical protein QL285_067009 [Trifolium repens]